MLPNSLNILFFHKLHILLWCFMFSEIFLHAYILKKIFPITLWFNKVALKRWDHWCSFRSWRDSCSEAGIEPIYYNVSLSSLPQRKLLKVRVISHPLLDSIHVLLAWYILLFLQMWYPNGQYQHLLKFLIERKIP